MPCAELFLGRCQAGYARHRSELREVAGGSFSEGQSGNGTLKIIGTANRDIRRVSIDESPMQDREMLEDLLLVALKDFNQKIESISQQQMAGVTGGLGLPPGLKLPF